LATGGPIVGRFFISGTALRLYREGGSAICGAGQTFLAASGST
jgi:hypothetical protein